jgi:hypothetical protein
MNFFHVMVSIYLLLLVSEVIYRAAAEHAEVNLFLTVLGQVYSAKDLPNGAAFSILQCPYSSGEMVDDLI